MRLTFQRGKLVRSVVMKTSARMQACPPGRCVDTFYFVFLEGDMASLRRLCQRRSIADTFLKGTLERARVSLEARSVKGSLLTVAVTERD